MMFAKHVVGAFRTGLGFLFALLELLAALLNFAVWTGKLTSSLFVTWISASC